MSGSAEAWACVTVWAVIAVVLVTTGPAGMLLAVVAAGCAVHRAHADGVGVHVIRR